MVETKLKEFKIVTLGEGRVGKTSLLLKYVKDSFDAEQGSTINANFLTKDITVDGRTSRCHIWDTAGQEKYRALARIYYRNAVGAVVVYDITDRNSFQRVVAWVTELQRMADPHIAMVIVGNKCDMESKRQVQQQEAVAYARSVGAAHFLTSAKTGKGIPDVFIALTKRLQAVPQDNTSRSEKQGKKLKVVPQTKKDSDCC